MSENYIVINGKKAELTEEQLEKLGIITAKENPFTRVIGHRYCYITQYGKVQKEVDTCHNIDNTYYNIANYCTDEELMKQRALHETLNRLLWRFACENGELENEWDGCDAHFYIWQHAADKNFLIKGTTSEKMEVTYFPTREIAEKALRDIVKPFMVAHPDFAW